MSEFVEHNRLLNFGLADAALMMQLGCDGGKYWEIGLSGNLMWFALVFVGSGIFHVSLCLRALVLDVDPSYVVR